MAKVLSILTASIRPADFVAMCDNLQKTAADPSSFELLCKIDIGDDTMRAVLDDEVRKRPYLIRYVVTPRRLGYWSVWEGINELWPLTSPDSYFTIAINDQTHFATPGWDANLRKYVGRFPDDIFHLRLSYRRTIKFKSLVECVPFGESYAVMTRKWVELVGTPAVGRAGVDTGPECVNFFLREHCGIDRGVPAPDVAIANEDIAISANDGLSESQWVKKLRGIEHMYAEFLTRAMVENFYRIARRLQAGIWVAQQGGKGWPVVDDMAARQVVVRDAGGGAVQTLPFAVEFDRWIVLLTQVTAVVDPEMDWLKWVPVQANLRVVRNEIARQWMAVPDDQLQTQFQGPLGHVHRRLIAQDLRPHESVAQEAHLQSIVRKLEGDAVLNEPEFVDSLVTKLLASGKDDAATRARVLLALSLFLGPGRTMEDLRAYDLVPQWLVGEFPAKVVHIPPWLKLVQRVVPQGTRDIIRNALFSR